MKKIPFEDFYEIWQEEDKEEQGKYSWNEKNNTPYYEQKPFTYGIEGQQVWLSTRTYPWDPINTVSVEKARTRKLAQQRITRSTSRQVSAVSTPVISSQNLPRTPIEDTGFDFDDDTPEIKEQVKEEAASGTIPASSLLLGQQAQAPTAPKAPSNPIIPTQTQTQAMSTTVVKDERGPPMAAPTPFNGDRKTTRKFLHECQLYFSGKPKDFQVNGTTDDKLKIAFMLSYMNKGTASTWAQRYQNRPDVARNSTLR